MKNNFPYILLLAILTQFTFSCKTTKVEMEGSDYLSKLKKEISSLGDIDTDDKSVPRVARAGIDSLKIADRDRINAYLNSLVPKFPAKTEYIVIMYYPGKDGCNSTGDATRESLGYENIGYNREIKKRSNVSQLNLYKDDDGIERWNKHRVFVKDKDLVISNQFFKYHYSCYSYLVWHQSGKYYYHYGPNSTEYSLYEMDLFVDAVRTGQI